VCESFRYCKLRETGVGIEEMKVEIHTEDPRNQVVDAVASRLPAKSNVCSRFDFPVTRERNLVFEKQPFLDQ
jgi:hypothetical protein